MNILRDTKLVFRQLMASRGYTTGVVTVLALGIGANAGIFSAVHAVLLEPTPVKSPHDLVMVWATDPSRSLPVVELSYRMFEHWSQHSETFSAAAVVGSSLWPAVLSREGAPVRLASSGVSASFFDTLGVAPLHGRTLLATDDKPGAAPVAVLNHATWITHFGGDPAAVGSTVRFDRPRTIVGIMPPGFDFPSGSDFWIPVVPVLAGVSQPGFDALESVGVLFMVGRLTNGTAPAVAVAQLDALAAGSASVPAPRRFGSQVVVTPFLDHIVGPARDGLHALWAAVGLVLLIGCTNVAGLMLTRVATRQRDHAVRAALGATRFDLARLWLIEAALLAIGAGALGIIIGWWMTRAIAVLAPPDIPGIADIALNPAVAAFCATVVLATAAACGAAPALRAASAPVMQGLTGTSPGNAGDSALRSRSALVVVQVAVSVVLVVSAGLITRSFGSLRGLDLGFTPADALTMFVDTRSKETLPRMLEEIRMLPDVQEAGAVYLRPLQLGAVGNDTTVTLEEQTADAARDNPQINLQAATPGFFDAAGVRLIHGRFFSEDDRANSQPVVLVSETAATRLWGGRDAVGRRILLRNQKVWRTVVGVVADVHYRGLGDVRLDAYEPAHQSSVWTGNLVIRTHGDPLHTATAAQVAIRRVDPNALVDSITTLDAIVARAVAPWRFTSWLLGVVAAIAFLITTVGLFTIVSLRVAHRRHELAVRLALGARGSDVMRAVLLPALAHASVGLAVGSLGAMVAADALRGLLFGVDRLDPVTWAWALGILAVTSAMAAWLPARCAATIRPAILLRQSG